MSKTPAVSNLASGFRSSNKLNENFEEIRDAFENTISRDGSSPNEMLAPLDMNSQPILNLPQPTNPLDPVRLIDWLDRPVVGTALVTTIEALGAVGDGIHDDSKAFLEAARLLPYGWNVRGYGMNYVINQKITISAEVNPTWETLTTVRMGKLTIDGTVRATMNDVAFDLYGNRGGAAGCYLEIGTLVGPGFDQNNSIGVQMTNGENFVKIGEILGFDQNVVVNGGWSSRIEHRSSINANKCLVIQLGTVNQSTSNDITVIADHIGGPFLNVTLPARRAVTARYGVYMDHATGCHINAGDVQYVQRTTDAIGIYLGPDTVGNTIEAYVEGSVPWNETGQLVLDRGHNNKLQLSASLSPDNVSKAMTLSGVGSELKGLGQRTNPGSAAFMAPERGAGSIRVRPGNKWTDHSNVHDHENMYPEPYNLHQIALSSYARSTNCTYAALTTGLPDVNDLQPGGRFTVDTTLDTPYSPGPPVVLANRAGGSVTSGAFSISPVAYDRPINVICYVRLISGPAAVAVYLKNPAVVAPFPNAYISQGLDVVNQWQRIKLTGIIPAGSTGVQVLLGMRPAGDEQVGNIVVDWAQPIVSWQEDPWSVSGLVPATPLVVRGKTLLEPLLPTKYDTTVNGAGVIDCNYAPLVRITAAAANIGVLANLGTGMTTILNDTAAAIDINVSAGVAAIKTISARRFVNLYRITSAVDGGGRPTTLYVEN